MTVTISEYKRHLQPGRGFNLTIVRVNTSEPGLYGLGCGTFTYRHETVAHVIEEYLKPPAHRPGLCRASGTSGR